MWRKRVTTRAAQTTNTRATSAKVGHRIERVMGRRSGSASSEGETAGPQASRYRRLVLFLFGERLDQVEHAPAHPSALEPREQGGELHPLGGHHQLVEEGAAVERVALQRHPGLG